MTHIVVVAAVVLAVSALVLSVMWMRWTPARTHYPTQGISVSADQGTVDWRSVRSQGVDFAYIRATTGTDIRDPAFATNWAGARAAGLRYGAELVFDLCKLASDQATEFITTVPRDNAALPPVVRLAFSSSCSARPGRDAILSELNTLLNLVESHSGKPALLHISRDFDQLYDVGSGINRTLWLDGNFFPPDYAARPWVMWTASDGRRIEGIAGPVEWDVVAP
ncbi:MAG: GH25 family lysozyme [Sphingobium sp.]